MLEKIDNYLKLLKLSFTILTLTSKTLPIRLTLEAKNTDNKFETVRQNKNLRNEIVNLRLHNIENLTQRSLHYKIIFNKRSGR